MRSTKSERPESYLVTTTIGKRARKFVWNSEKPLNLEYPSHWVLKKEDNGIRVVKLNKSRKQESQISIDEKTIASGKAVSLGGTSVSFQKLRPIPPVYNSPIKADPKLPKQTFLFYGTKGQLVHFRVASTRYVGNVEKKAVFAYWKAGKKYALVAYQPDVYFRDSAGQENRLLQGDPIIIRPEEMAPSKIRWNDHWWRINLIPLSPPLPENLQDNIFEEQSSFKKIIAQTIIGIVTLAVLGIILPTQQKSIHSLPTLRVVELKKPKMIFTQPTAQKKVTVVAQKKLEKPPAPKIVKLEPKPIPKAAPPAMVKPPKRISMETHKRPPKQEQTRPIVPPKSVPAPAPKIAKESHVPVKSPPAPVAVSQPRTPPVKKPTGPSAEVIRARAELNQSLGFLSSNNKVVAKTTDYAVATSKDDQEISSNVVSKGLGKKSDYLGKIARSGGDVGDIKTKGARNVRVGNIVDENGLGDGTARGKTLNHVQGKVALNSLYSEGGAPDGEVGGALSKGGITMSGAGQISESAVMKALSQKLQELQYCYEKALLSDATLAGNVMMEWTISTSGGVTNVKVVRSQLNNKGLQQCLARIISKTHFPSPQGGSVTIRYPFSFTSTTL